ncbi:MAG: hypothetical protein ACRECE_11325, partial [Xanthobacteraceae bacterium]
MSSAQDVVDPKAIPPEIDRWNWGAFLLNWIWGIGNNTFIALLTLVPFVGFVMPFVLALQLFFDVTSESMGDHDSEDHGWLAHRSRRRWSYGRRRYER